jgi:hypothetical protein
LNCLMFNTFCIRLKMQSILRGKEGKEKRNTSTFFHILFPGVVNVDTLHMLS